MKKLSNHFIIISFVSHKVKNKDSPVRIELTSNAMLSKLVNRYTIQGTQKMNISIFMSSFE